jgi:hypothetical protein
MTSRWEALLDQKPVPLLDALVTQVSKLLAESLMNWPLPVQDVDLETLGDFGAHLSAESLPPVRGVFVSAFRLARWELQRDTAAFDDFMRHQRYLQDDITVSDRSALLFITRWLVEQLLALSEATHSRVKRADLIRCLDETEQLWTTQRP